MSTLEQQWRDNVSAMLDKQGEIATLMNEKMEVHLKLISILEQKVARLESVVAQRN